ncbi:hypothetical protein EHO58_17940 [Leptospira selangorensis]|uniref:hypothetical protein n=1 Tax=Leptospira selangorensis TaxID=2484982 RepID=UPI0010831DB8|nr:hypothetical protein [Leptospira selangorensis]TGK01630.1 hypothetical protein EHO58_17940 [Leptospira selangorensis]
MGEELRNNILDNEKSISELNYSYDQILNIVQSEYERYIQQYKINKNASLLLGYYQIMFMHFFRIVTLFNRTKNRFKRAENIKFEEISDGISFILKELKLDFPHFMRTARSVRRYDRSIRETNTTFENILVEKLYLDTYTNLEVYLQNIVAILLNCFPVYLNKTELKLKVENIFRNDIKNIQDLKGLIIQEEISSIFHSKNIADVIPLLLRKFKIDYHDEYGDNLNELFFHSKVRNHIIHSTGIVNKKLLTDLSSRKIDHKLTEGENLKSILKSEIDFFTDVAHHIMRTTNSLVYNDVHRMYNHNQLSNKYDA